MQSSELFGPSGVPDFSFVPLTFLTGVEFLSSLTFGSLVFGFPSLFFNGRAADLSTPLKIAFEPY